jgi:hypothetical protein
VGEGEEDNKAKLVFKSATKDGLKSEESAESDSIQMEAT